mmetsp:Transcript_130265/g.259834  ORF Transcript_130265/g.259834 Transcript_130265/m.259834 type:complete len:205 (+) Transcript_130265:163-777(+)
MPTVLGKFFAQMWQIIADLGSKLSSRRSASFPHSSSYLSAEYVAMIAKVSFQLARFEEATSLSKSLVMMLPTVDKKESPCKRKNSSRALVQSVVPPPEASRRASAILPCLKQHSTAAVKLPTIIDCLMIASGPAPQSVAFATTVLGLAISIACSASFFCSRSISSCFFCSVLADSSSKKFSACVRSSSGPRDGAACAGLTPLDI